MRRPYSYCILAMVLLALFFQPKKTLAQSWQWVTTQTLGNNSLYAYSRAIAQDPSGNFVIVGDFQGTIMLGNTTLTSVGQTDIFVAKMTPTGTWLQAVRAGGPGVDRPIDVVVDSNGNITVGGYFFSTSATFGSTTVTNTSPNSSADIFIATLSATGTWTRAVSAGTSGEDFLSGLALQSNGTVVAAGYYGYHCASCSISFGPYTLPTQGAQGTPDAFVARLSSLGTWTQAVRAGGDGIDMINDVVLDAAGNAVVTGSFSGNSIDFGTALSLQNQRADNTSDIFIARLSATGSWTQAVRAGGPNSDAAPVLDIDGNGNATVAGSINTTMQFGALTLSSGSGGIYVARCDASGSWTAATVAQGANAFTPSVPYAVKLDSQGNAYVAGSYSGNYLQLGALSLPQVSGTFDLFVAKLSSANVWTNAIKAGGGDQDAVFGLLLDRTGGVIVTGYVASTQVVFNGPLAPTEGGAFVARLTGILTANRSTAQTLPLALAPNPVTEGVPTTIAYHLETTDVINADVLDALGRSVLVLAHEQRQNRGPHTLELPSRGLTAGVYTVRLVHNGVTAYSKLVVE